MGFAISADRKKPVSGFVVALFVVETGDTFLPRTRIVAFLLENVDSRRQIDAL
jgi:hypothetical protein